MTPSDRPYSSRSTASSVHGHTAGHLLDEVDVVVGEHRLALGCGPFGEGLCVRAERFVRGGIDGATEAELRFVGVAALEDADVRGATDQ
jgi:hypothetical protein